MDFSNQSQLTILGSPDSWEKNLDCQTSVVNGWGSGFSNLRRWRVINNPNLGQTLHRQKWCTKMVAKEAVTSAPLILGFLCFLRRKQIWWFLFSTRWCSVGLKSYHRMASCRGVWTVASGALEGSAEPSRVSLEHLVTQFLGVPGSRCTWNKALRLVQRMSMATKKSWDSIFLRPLIRNPFVLSSIHQIRQGSVICGAIHIELVHGGFFFELILSIWNKIWGSSALQELTYPLPSNFWK